jgi:uncharacterized tellurite resistance protein B-like protein
MKRRTEMRHYPADSPKAAARVIALALLADGAIDPSELATLKDRHTLNRFGLTEKEFDAVIHALCEDLIVYSHRAAAGHLEIGRDALRDVLSEVRSQRLRKRLLHAVLDIANADGNLVGGEAVLIACAAECWGIDPFDAFRISALPQGRPTMAAAARPSMAHWQTSGAH